MADAGDSQFWSQQSDFMSLPLRRADFAEMLGLNPSVLKGAWEKNLEVRPEQDWKELKGRAVTDG